MQEPGEEAARALIPSLQEGSDFSLCLWFSSLSSDAGTFASGINSAPGEQALVAVDQ